MPDLAFQQEQAFALALREEFARGRAFCVRTCVWRAGVRLACLRAFGVRAGVWRAGVRLAFGVRACVPVASGRAFGVRACIWRAGVHLACVRACGVRACLWRVGMRLVLRNTENI
jgi:hypothetical protein